MDPRCLAQFYNMMSLPPHSRRYTELQGIRLSGSKFLLPHDLFIVVGNTVRLPHDTFIAVGYKPSD